VPDADNDQASPDFVCRLSCHDREPVLKESWEASMLPTTDACIARMRAGRNPTGENQNENLQQNLTVNIPLATEPSLPNGPIR